MKKYLLILALVILTTSCVQVNWIKLGPGNIIRELVATDQVAIYLTAGDVKGDYEQIALLNARGNSLWTNEAEMIWRLREQAGKLGANGIILDALSEPSAGAKVAGAIFGVGVDRKGKCIAIFVGSKETHYRFLDGAATGKIGAGATGAARLDLWISYFRTLIKAQFDAGPTKAI